MMDMQKTETSRQLIQWMLDQGISMQDAVDVSNCMEDTNYTLPQALEVILFQDEDEEDEDEDDDDEDLDTGIDWFEYLRDITEKQLRLLEGIIQSKKEKIHG